MRTFGRSRMRHEIIDRPQHQLINPDLGAEARVEVVSEAFCESARLLVVERALLNQSLDGPIPERVPVFKSSVKMDGTTWGHVTSALEQNKHYSTDAAISEVTPSSHKLWLTSKTGSLCRHW